MKLPPELDESGQRVNVKISVEFSVKVKIQLNHLKIKIKKMKSEINSVNQSIRAPQLLIAPQKR